MVRIPLGCFVVAGIVAGASEAVAAPLSLPLLNLTLELPDPPAWAISDDDRDGTVDRLYVGAEPPLVVDISRIAARCDAWASSAVGTFAEVDWAKFVRLPAWAPAGWFPAAGELASGDGKVIQLCRDLGSDRNESVMVMVIIQERIDVSRPVGSLLGALERALRTKGVPGIDYGDDSVAIVAITTLNIQIDRKRGPATIEAEPVASVHASRPHREDRDDHEKRPARPARYDGVRAAVDVAALSLEGDSVDGGGRFGASLTLPIRYRRRGADKGWAFGARVAAGRAGDVVVGDGHVAIGGAFGKPRTQVALVMVVGGDRAPAGSPLTTQDGGFAGLQMTLRMPVTRQTDVEAAGTLVAGSHGRGSWLELSLVSVRCAPVSCLLGVERRTWDDGMSSLGIKAGLGY